MKTMKTAVIIGILFSAMQVLATQKFSDAEQNCISELNLNKGEIEDILKDESIYFPENNAHFSDFISCYWKKTGYQDENGNINHNNLIQLLKNFPRNRFGASSASGPLGVELATEGIEACKNNPPGNSHGETAVKLQNCVTKYIAEYLKNQN